MVEISPPQVAMNCRLFFICSYSMRATLEADVEVGKGVGVAIIVNSDNLQQSGFSYINLISKTDISLFAVYRSVAAASYRFE